MYSYEDRIRAVELYIKLGKRVRPTIRQLGYPTKNSLKDWYREYQQRLDLRVGHGLNFLFTPPRQVGALREVWAQQSVRVLGRAALPRTVRVSKDDVSQLLLRRFLTFGSSKELST